MAATVDAHVTVKQHGFHVKHPLSAPLGGSDGGAAAAAPLAPGSDRREREDGPARGLLSFAPLPCVPCGSGAPSSLALLPGSGCLEPADHAHLTPGVKRLMKSVVRGLKAFQEPEAASEGLGGTYFFTNEAGQKIAIMKPCDEEPLAPNNPKGFVGRQLGEPGLKPTVRVGEAAAREVAAYLLDHERFARVPHTVMVRMTHPIFHVGPSSSSSQQPGEDGAPATPATPAGPPCKLGSLQQFVPHECDTSEMGASRFSVRDVQRIGILDLRLFNTDRHAGNMLVRRPRPAPGAEGGLGGAMAGGAAAMLDRAQYELVPIDHGFALPEALEPPYFEWQHWPQAMLPFGKEELDYIARLDAKADIQMLRQEVPSLRVESLRVLEVCTTLLKAGAAAGLTLAEIAGVATRPLIGMEEEPSELERICFNARAEVEDWSESEEEELAVMVEGEDEGADSEEEGVVAMLSMEYEDEAQCPSSCCSSGSASDASTSPTAASDRASSAFKLSMAGSEASRLEESLFQLDEEGGARTPPRARSPDAPTVRLPPSRFAAEAAGKGGAAAAGQQAQPLGAPVTPATAAKGLSVSFVSPLSAGDADSLPASFDSLGLHDSPNGGTAMSLAAPSSLAASSGFAGPASFAPSASSRSAQEGGMSAGGGMRGTSRRSARKHRSRRKLAIGSRLLKLTTQNYPPLVESRGGSGASPSMSALAVFRDLSEEQWQAFMASVRAQLARKLRDGAWKSAAAAQGPPMMSCPRF